MTFTEIAIKYADDILHKKIVSCLAVKQACKRFKSDLEAIENSDCPFDFNKEAVEEYEELFKKVYVNIYPSLKKSYKNLTNIQDRNNKK